MSSARTAVVTDAHKALSSARNRQYITKLFEYFNASVIFAFLLRNGLQFFLSGTLRLIFFPAAIAISLVKLMFIMRQAQLESRIQGEANGGTIMNALFEVALTTSLAVSIIGGLAAQAIFSLISPIILIISIAAKSLFDVAKSLHYLAKGIAHSIHARTPNDESVTTTSYQNMRNSLISATTNGIIAATIGILVFTNLEFIGMIGLVAGVVGMTTMGLLRRDRATVTLIEDSTLEVARVSPVSTKDIVTELTVRKATNVTIEYGGSFYFRKVAKLDSDTPVKGFFDNKNPVLKTTENHFHSQNTERTITTYRPR